jgi:Fic family protein
MILNHKHVLRYIIDEKNNIWLDKKTFYELHTLLGRDILHNSQLGVIRSHTVKIWASSYTPLESSIQLEIEFNIFLEKLRDIENPFEQSLFILVFIPYFQLFYDINKRVSRISCNIPLIQHWLPPLSLLQVSERDYIDAILWVYELNDTSLLAQIYTDNYLLNLERYI